MKKLSRILSAAGLLGAALSVTGCNQGGKLEAIAKEDIKIGLICLHDENSTYDLNFINSMKEAVKNLGLNEETQLVIRTGIGEDATCYDTASSMVDDGCNIVFADSFGHEAFMIKAAKAFKSVRFAHATGTKAHTEKLANYYNAFADIYQGRYLAGVAGGMKLKELMDNNQLKDNNKDANGNVKLGYVGAFTYAEVVSGFTSWYLGVQSVVPNVVMDVTFTGSWYDPVAEKAGAEKLIQGGAALVSQHADSMGAPEACKAAGVPNVSYNGSTEATCAGSFVVGSKINWAPYYEYLVNSTINNTKIDWDYSGTIAGGSVQLTDLGSAAAAGTADKLAEVKAKLISGELKVYDTNKFTVKGAKLTTYQADVDDFGDYKPDTEAVKDGYFNESAYRSAPYFDLQIDGINYLDTKF